MITIYLTNHQNRQLIDFLKKYPCIKDECIIHVTNCRKYEFQKFRLEKNQKY